MKPRTSVASRSPRYNAQPGSREYLEAKHGQVWNTSELSDDFEVIGFAAPLVVSEGRATA